MSDKLLQVYKHILKTGNIETDSEDYLVKRISKDRTEPFLVDGKRLVLPTTKWLKESNRDSFLVFHPLVENMMAKNESPIMTKFRAALNLKLNVSIASLIHFMVGIAVNEGDHKKLNPDQSSVLSVLKNATPGTLKEFGTIHNEILQMFKTMTSGKLNRMFVAIHLRRNGEVDGKPVSRLGVVSFPLYDSLKGVEGAADISDIKLTKKSKEMLISMYEYIFPKLKTDRAAYNAGSDSAIAPFLDAMMKTVYTVGAVINGHVYNFENLIPDHESLLIPAEWYDDFNNLGELNKELFMVPMQKGNDGTKTVEKDPKRSIALDEVLAAPASKEAPARPEPTYDKGIPESVEAHPNPNVKVVSFDELFGRGRNDRVEQDRGRGYDDRRYERDDRDTRRNDRDYDRGGRGGNTGWYQENQVDERYGRNDRNYRQGSSRDYDRVSDRYGRDNGGRFGHSSRRR